jgi:hypothetical protein
MPTKKTDPSRIHRGKTNPNEKKWVGKKEGGTKSRKR